jgi:hypothetical protein
LRLRHNTVKVFRVTPRTTTANSNLHIRFELRYV